MFSKDSQRVKIADLEKRGDAEVEAVQVVPVLPLGEHDGAEGEVEEHHPDTGSAGDQHLLLPPAQSLAGNLLHVAGVLHHLVLCESAPPGGAVVDLPVNPFEQICKHLTR